MASNEARNGVAVEASKNGARHARGSADGAEPVRESKRQRLPAGDLARVLTRAVALVYHAAPRQLILTTGLTLAGAGLAAVQILFARHALDALLKVNSGKASVTSALVPFAAMALIAAVTGVLTIVAVQLERLLGQRVQRAALHQLLEVCAGVDLESYENPAFFDQHQRVTMNAMTRPVSVAQGLIGLVRGVVGGVLLVVVLFLLAPALVPVLLLIAIPLTLSSRRASRLEFRFIAENTSRFRQRYYLQDIMWGRPAAKEVRAFGLGQELLRRWNQLWDEYLVALRQLVKRKLLLAVAGRITSAALTLGALALLLVLVSHHDISLASAGAAGLALVMLATRIEMMANGGSSLYESGLFLADYDNFMSLQGTHELARGTKPAPPEFHELRVAELGFKYPRSDTYAVRGVDMTIRQGEVVALVGENGSGKTTLAKLLANLYQPTEGSIRWDGHDVAEMEPSSVRDSVSVIFQDFVMYALSAAQNIGVGRPQAIDDLTMIIEAAKQAGAHDFLDALPAGYENFLSNLFEGGRDLSVGQWQRIALARALYRDAPFVILDEPSSALDPRAEAELFNRIRSVLAGKTVLLISHRFSSVRSADRIYVMEQGRIVEQGSHEELMEEEGLYADLFSLQASAYLARTPA